VKRLSAADVRGSIIVLSGKQMQLISRLLTHSSTQHSRDRTQTSALEIIVTVHSRWLFFNSVSSIRACNPAMRKPSHIGKWALRWSVCRLLCPALSWLHSRWSFKILPPATPGSQASCVSYR
jgi:hypothetical protein